MRPIDIDIDDDFGVMEEPEDIGTEETKSAPSPSAVARAAAKAETAKASAPSEAEKQATAEDIETALEQKPEYVFPPLSLLVHGERNNGGNTDEQLRQTAAKDVYKTQPKDKFSHSVS